MTVRPVKGSWEAEFVGKDLKATVAELEHRTRTAATDLEFEEAGRLHDEIRRLEVLDLGLDPPARTAPPRPWVLEGFGYPFL